MSIISEALKKANTENRPLSNRSLTVRTGTAGQGRRWIAGLFAAAVIVTPFYLPRFIHHTEPAAKNIPGSETSPQALPMADVPAEPVSSGLAQMSIESGGMPSAATSVRLAAGLPTNVYLLQGTVWTQDKGSYAILNNKVVRVGSAVGNYRVERIGDGQITLTDGSQQLTVLKSS